MPSESPIACTVVVPSYRGSHRLPRLLEALRAQDYVQSWELVVVLDGPDPVSLSLLESVEDTLPLRVIELPENGGVAAAMQAGVDAARGTIVLRCDDDLAPRPDFVTRHMGHHASGAPVGVIGATRDVFADTAYARAYGIRANRLALTNAYARPEAQRWVGWAANNSAPKAWIDAVGGFDRTLWYGEDSELGFRLQKAGLEIVVDRNLETEHHGPATSASSRAARAFVSGASRAAFLERHPGHAHVENSTKPPRSVLGRLWQSTVAILSSCIRTRRGYSSLGRGVDLLLPFLPSKLGGKLVALLVEAGGEAGARSHIRDLGVFSGQKDLELAAERKAGDHESQ